MSATQYYVASSIDGFMATGEDDLAWLFEFNGADGQVAAYERFYEGVGALVMGAGTFRFLLDQGLTEWPYPGVPTWVFSHTELPRFEGADIRFVQGGVASVHREALAAAGEKNLWLVGGGNLAAQFYELGLLDELLLTLVPVLLGSGKALLPLGSPTAPLQLIHQQVLGKAWSNCIIGCRGRKIPLRARVSRARPWSEPGSERQSFGCRARLNSPDHIGHPDCGKPTALLIGHHDFMRGQCPTEVDRGAGSGNQALGGCPMVAGPDLDSQCLPGAQPGVDSGREGTQGFRQNYMGSAMQQAGDLGVPAHGHRGDDPVPAQFQERDLHFLDQVAHPVIPQGLVHRLGHAGLDELLSEGVGSIGIGFGVRHGSRLACPADSTKLQSSGSAVAESADWTK